MSLYEIKFKDAKGQERDLSEYKGKVLLIVNVASKCGFTPQYEGLEKLYEEYKDKGLMIVGFPCNQFLEQEPGSDSEIQEYCRATWGVSFPVFAKIDVNGDNTAPIYKELKEMPAGENIDVPEDFQHYELFKKVQGGKHWGKNIPWNFTKFLLDRSGKVAGRYAPTADLSMIEDKIKTQL